VAPADQARWSRHPWDQSDQQGQPGPWDQQQWKLHPWDRLDLEDLLDLEDQGQWMLHLSDPSGQSGPADQWGQQRM